MNLATIPPVERIPFVNLKGQKVEIVCCPKIDKIQNSVFCISCEDLRTMDDCFVRCAYRHNQAMKEVCEDSGHKFRVPEPTDECRHHDNATKEEDEYGDIEIEIQNL